MSLCGRLSWGLRFGLWAAVLAVPGLLLAIEPAKSPAPDGEAVELFAAIEAGQLEAKLIPRDSSQVRLFLTNKTKQPLSVAMPATFAAANIPGAERALFSDAAHLPNMENPGAFNRVVLDFLSGLT